MHVIFAKDYVFVTLNDSIFSKKSNSEFSQVIEENESSFFKPEEKVINKNEILTIGNPNLRHLGEHAEIKGIITEKNTGEPVIGAVVYCIDLNKGTSTDVFGNYSIKMEKGKHQMLFKSVGKKEQTVAIILNSDGKLNYQMEDDVVLLKDILISAEREHNVRGLEVGLESMDIKTIKQLPSTMGEADIIKTALLLPGIQTMGEGASGFNVRGGSTDQNLVLIDNSPIYNSAHLFGFFSALNSDIVKGFDIYKSSFPAYFGGRLSSVLDINLRNGNKKEFAVIGGISPITGKLLVEGPIFKEKASFIVSARTTYSDWILKRINASDIQNSSASFYDFNAKMTFDFNSNNSLTISGYQSKDYFKLNSDTTYSYKNQIANISWKHAFSNKLYALFDGIYSEYNYSVESSKNLMYGFEMTYRIQHQEAKIGLVFQPNSKHKIRFGGNSILYKVAPGELTPFSDSSEIIPKKLPQDQGIESAVYVDDEYLINDRLSVNVGFRFSSFLSMGTGWEYEYLPDLPRTINNRMDSTYYSGNVIRQKYGFPEFRFSVRFGIDANSSIKASFSNMNQYIHMLSNTMAISPTDSWALSNRYLKPQKGKQVSFGYYKNFGDDKIETSVEAYYKTVDNMPEYKAGADLVLNQNLDCDLINGHGKAYGIELMVEKKSGKFTGWMSYTFARSFLRVNGKFAEEKINDGNYFPTNHDKPHDLTLVANYKYSRRISFSSTITYNTGRPITYPVAKYRYRGRELLHYSYRNEYRIPDYFRVDIALNIEGNLKQNKWAHSYWSFSIYNLLGRNNVYSIYFRSTDKVPLQGYKLSIFSQPIPSITYNFKF